MSAAVPQQLVVEQLPRFHLEIGANLMLKRTLRKRHGCGLPNVTCVLFEPQPRFHNDSTRKSHELNDTYFVPFAAWIRNETLSLYTHPNALGVGSSIYPDSVWVQQAKKDRVDATVQVPALDLAEWMARHVPLGVHLTAHIDVEGAEYVLLRHLILHGQACRFTTIDLEGHALYNEQHVGFRALEVTLPWMLHGCGSPRPPRVRIMRYYGTKGSMGREPRIGLWESRRGATDWCPNCALLDDLLPVTLGLPDHVPPSKNKP